MRKQVLLNVTGKERLINFLFNFSCVLTREHTRIKGVL